ncbi:hypothetical protein [Pseudomonas brassicacearum]|uniref:hypothetical protein n=1 Tax=Pseudomonas brassicacearum TaxID=930166 RepID=UPI000578F42E|nr:hypothetical protein [Pseudomonas brassicacearum]
MHFKIFISLFSVLALIGGCSASRPESGTMLKTWSESVANLGVRAVYPLQESLYPGNLLLVPTYPGKTRSDEKPSEFYTYYPAPVGSLDLCKLYLSIRSAPELPQISGYPVKGGEPAGEKPVAPWQPTAINYSNFKCSGYKGADFRVNRVTAFPAFQFGSRVESGMGANVMAGTVGAKGSVVGTDEYLMTISVPSVTVIRVDVPELLTALGGNGFKTKDGFGDLQNVVARMMQLQTFVDKQGNSSKPELLLVSEVYYANAIDISVTSSAGQAAQLAVSTQALVERFEKLAGLRDQMKSMMKEAPATQGSNQAQPNTQTQQTAMKELAREIGETEAEVDKLSKALLPDAPGVTGAVKSVSSSGVTLTQVFPRPMAIGYRAIGLNPDQLIGK